MPSGPYMAGMAIGLQDLEGLKFDPQADHAGCKLCGAVYQSDLDRTVARKLRQGVPRASLQGRINEAYRLRQEWRSTHARVCKYKGAAPPVGGFSAEAALCLTPLGTFPLLPNQEVAHAMAEAPRAPLDDVEGS